MSNQEGTTPGSIAAAQQLGVEARMALASAARLDERTQLVLAADSSHAVRACLAGNHQVSPAAQQVLARDPDAGVRTYLRENTAVTLSTALPEEFLLESPAELFEVRAQEREALEELARAAGVDPEALEALRTGWTGTVSELLRTALEFAPHRA
jgi:hypothetical protein